jgi:hypothetical protein
MIFSVADSRARPKSDIETNVVQTDSIVCIWSEVVNRQMPKLLLGKTIVVILGPF